MVSWHDAFFVGIRSSDVKVLNYLNHNYKEGVINKKLLLTYLKIKAQLCCTNTFTWVQIMYIYNLSMILDHDAHSVCRHVTGDQKHNYTYIMKTVSIMAIYLYKKIFSTC